MEKKKKDEEVLIYCNGSYEKMKQLHFGSMG